MHEIFKPVLILLVICVIVSFSVSLVFNVTDDTIKEMEIKANELLMSAVLPDAKPFTEVKDVVQAEDATVKINNVYQSEKGLVFNMTTKGYGGDVTVFVGINKDGTVNNIKLGSNNETPSVGKKAEEGAFTDQFIDISVNQAVSEQVDTISGATITSKGVVKAVQEACNYYSSDKVQELFKEGK